MDPIERINIRGDSTFALLLEAQARGHALFYYTPDRLAHARRQRVARPSQPLTVRDVQGDHFTLGEPQRADLSTFDVVLLRQDPPFDIAYITTTHLLERIHPKTLVVNDPAQVRNAPEKLFVTEFPDLMPPTLITRDRRRDRGVPRGARRHRHEAALRQRRRGGVPGRRRTTELRLAARPVRRPRSASPGWCSASCREVREGDKRIILVDGEPVGAVNRVPARRRHCAPTWCAAARAETTELTDARARDLRAHRAGAARARPDLRRHRRDRRLPDRDQRHLADRHPRDQALRRRRTSPR